MYLITQHSFCYLKDIFVRHFLLLIFNCLSLIWPLLKRQICISNSTRFLGSSKEIFMIVMK